SGVAAGPIDPATVDGERAALVTGWGDRVVDRLLGERPAEQLLFFRSGRYAALPRPQFRRVRFSLLYVAGRGYRLGLWHGAGHSSFATGACASIEGRLVRLRFPPLAPARYVSDRPGRIISGFADRRRIDDSEPA